MKGNWLDTELLTSFEGRSPTTKPTDTSKNESQFHILYPKHQSVLDSDMNGAGMIFLHPGNIPAHICYPSYTLFCIRSETPLILCMHLHDIILSNTLDHYARREIPMDRMYDIVSPLPARSRVLLHSKIVSCQVDKGYGWTYMGSHNLSPVSMIISFIPSSIEFIQEEDG